MKKDWQYINLAGKIVLRSPTVSHLTDPSIGAVDDSADRQKYSTEYETKSEQRPILKAPILVQKVIYVNNNA